MVETIALTPHRGLLSKPFLHSECHSVAEENEALIPCGCPTRNDNSGVWNTVKAWYLFMIYLLTCAMLLVTLRIWVDGQDFQTGAAPALLTSELYQAQINGLVSLWLTLIRMLAGPCSMLLIWRAILILLDREGLTLVEMMRLSKYRIPILPRGSSWTYWLWIFWLALVITFSLPSEFAAPLASSAIAWIPSTRISTQPVLPLTGLVDRSADWNFFSYSEHRLKSLISAATLAGKDPAYAFDPSNMSRRRYAPLNMPLPRGSKINLTMPHFNAKIEWIDGTSNLSENVGNAYFSDIADVNITSRANGTVGILRNGPFEVIAEEEPKIFSDHRIIYIKVNQLESHVPQADGSATRQDTPCPTHSEFLGKLPSAPQHEMNYINSGTKEWLGKDCFLVGNASITAGSHKSTNCTVDLTGNDVYIATCAEEPPRDEVQDDWLGRVGVDFISETMEYIAMLEIANSFMENGIENYTAGVLRLAYDAVWSSLTNNIARSKETVHAYRAQPVVRAAVAHPRLNLWFAMCALLMLSALLVAIAQSVASTKTIQDATLARMLLDLSEVAHSARAPGLCNAVDLNDKDKELPRLVFAKEHDSKQSHKCRRRLVFADEIQGNAKGV